MSGGPACACDERTRAPKHRRWVVTHRNAHRSAFAGYRWTPSRYSAVECLECRRHWRTKASYTDLLQDALPEK